MQRGPCLVPRGSLGDRGARSQGGARGTGGAESPGGPRGRRWCTALQALHEGLVVFDATGRKTQDDLGSKINGGTGLVDQEGVWVVPRPVDVPQDGESDGTLMWPDPPNAWSVLTTGIRTSIHVRPVGYGVASPRWPAQRLH